MGCLGRLLNLILLYTVFGLVGLAARMSALLLGFLLAVIFRIFIFLFGWIVISLMALRSPRRSADAIVDRINDWLLQAGLWRLTGPALNKVLQGLAYAGFALGWTFFILILIQLVQWIV